MSHSEEQYTDRTFSQHVATEVTRIIFADEGRFSRTTEQLCNQAAAIATELTLDLKSGYGEHSVGSLNDKYSLDAISVYTDAWLHPDHKAFYEEIMEIELDRDDG